MYPMKASAAGVLTAIFVLLGSSTAVGQTWAPPATGWPDGVFVPPIDASPEPQRKFGNFSISDGTSRGVFLSGSDGSILMTQSANAFARLSLSASGLHLIANNGNGAVNLSQNRALFLPLTNAAARETTPLRLEGSLVYATDEHALKLYDGVSWGRFDTSYTNEYRWNQFDGSHASMVTDGACFLTKVGGGFNGNGEVVHAYADANNEWFLGGTSGHPSLSVSAGARCLSSVVPGAPPAPPEWRDASGTGNNGESCAAWLSRTGQLGSERRTLDEAGATQSGKCIYNYMFGWIVQGENYAESGFYPTSWGVDDANGRDTYTQSLR